MIRVGAMPKQYYLRMDARVGNRNNQGNEALMLAYAAGDASAFDALYFRHKDKLYRYMFRQLATDAVVDELFQEVWSRVIRARNHYRETAAFTTWLFSIARNLIVDHYRAEGRQSELIDPVENMDDFTSTAICEPQHHVINAELAQRLKGLIGDLPPLQREAFLLKHEASLSLQEIASVTGSDRETVKSRLRYAVNKLRRQLAENHG
jgi:RNA polymerase sigma-70 factor (ECF subfamily)